MIEEVVKRLDDPATTELTYGIVTLNMQQRVLIERLLAEHLHPKIQELRETDDPKRRLFVLNLENVQGRERDVIVMGTSFSKRAGGDNMPLNFGPLTNPGGEKRLNVAVTRAKRQFVVVSSFAPSDMANPNSLGMIHLKEYLTRAAAVAAARAAEINEPPETIAAPEISGDTNHDFNGEAAYIAQISRRLTDRNIKVIAGRGLSAFKIDLALTLENRDDWLVAVLLDGREWASRPLVVDRDALPAALLSSMAGWPRVARLWMPAWRGDPDDVVDWLVALVHHAAANPSPPPATNEGDSVPVRDDGNGAAAANTDGQILTSTLTNGHHRDSDVSELTAPVASADSPALPGEESMTSYPQPGQLGTRAELNGLPVEATMLARGIVAAEGPISAEIVLKRVARAYNVGRVTRPLLNHLDGLIDSVTSTEWAHGVFLWPDDKEPAEWRGFRILPTSERPISEIAPEELVNLMAAIIHQSISIGTDGLVRACFAKLGGARMTAQVTEVIEAAINYGVEDGRILREGELLSCP